MMKYLVMVCHTETWCATGAWEGFGEVMTGYRRAWERAARGGKRPRVTFCLTTEAVEDHADLFAALRDEVDASVAAFFSSCVHCGICAQACPFYVETGDPKYTPILKVKPLRLVWEQEYSLWGKMKGMIGLSEKITDEQILQLLESASSKTKLPV